MSVQYLSPEWADEMTRLLNDDEPFRKEIGDRRSTVAWEVSDAPGGDVQFHLVVEGGAARLAIGPPPGEPDLRLFVTYETAAGLARGELAGREAFQSRRIRSDSRLVKVLRYLWVFHTMDRMSARLDVEY